MNLTTNQIAAATGATVPLAATWQPWLIAAMERFDINTPQRAAAFSVLTLEDKKI